MSFKDWAFEKTRKVGKNSSKVLEVTKKLSALTTAATIAALVGKYGSKLIYRLLSRK